MLAWRQNQPNKRWTPFPASAGRDENGVLKIRSPLCRTTVGFHGRQLKLRIDRFCQGENRRIAKSEGNPDFFERYRAQLKHRLGSDARVVVLEAKRIERSVIVLTDLGRRHW